MLQKHFIHRGLPWNFHVILSLKLYCQIIISHIFTAFPDNKPVEASDGKVVSTSNHWDKTNSNEVSVTFTVSPAAAKVLNHDLSKPIFILSF